MLPDNTNMTIFACYHVQWLHQTIEADDAYMRQWISSALVQVIAWCRIGDKQLPKTMVTKCQLESD